MVFVMFCIKAINKTKQKKHNIWSVYKLAVGREAGGGGGESVNKGDN